MITNKEYEEVVIKFKPYFQCDYCKKEEQLVVSDTYLGSKKPLFWASIEVRNNEGSYFISDMCDDCVKKLGILTGKTE